jgi:threonine/homoserine/homoserine lactone efflux protein
VEYLNILAALAAVYLAGNLSPGPNLVLVSQFSAAQSRLAGLMVGIGLTLGAVAWATAAVVGLGVVSYLNWLRELLRLAGGAYLIWLGLNMIVGTNCSSPSVTGAAGTCWRAFRVGLVANLANPYCFVFFGGTFAALLPADLPISVRAAAVAVIAVDALLWYAALAYLFSMAPIRRAFGRVKRWLDRIMGGLLGLFGLRMIFYGR